MTYTYQVLSGPDTGSTYEVEQKISEPARTTDTVNGNVVNVRRLISSSGGFILKGGCWGRDKYEHGVQSMPTKEDRANLGKPNK